MLLCSIVLQFYSDGILTKYVHFYVRRAVNVAWLGLVWLGMAAVYPKAIKSDAFFYHVYILLLSSLVAKCIQCMYIRMVQENALRQYCNITFKYKGIEGGVVTEIVCIVPA